MSAYVDVRPAGYDVAFRPGTTVTVTLEWPAGELAGRSFSATLGDAALSVVVDGDTMTVEATPAQTGAVTAPAVWLLLEDLGGDDPEPVMTGTWSPSDAANGATPAAVAVTVGAATVDVTVSSAQASIVALSDRVGIEHSWLADGWEAFTAVPMTADDAQVFAATVTGGRGVVTGTQPGDANMRVAYLRDGTTWADSEVTTLIWGPGAAWDGSNAQQGHLHRVRERAPGQWEGIAVWTSIVFGGDYSVIHAAGVRFDGATLGQSSGPSATAADAEFIDRTLRVTGRRRFSFGSVFQEYTTIRPDLWGLRVGDVVSITDDPDASFNETNVTVANADRVNGVVQVVDPAAGTSSAYAAVQNGAIRPSGGSSQKRWAPFWMSTRVVGGTAAAVTVEYKRWRYNEPEPDWGSLQVQRRALTANATVPALAVGPGRCGLWAAHFHDGSSGEWGHARFRRI